MCYFNPLSPLPKVNKWVYLHIHTYTYIHAGGYTYINTNIYTHTPWDSQACSWFKDIVHILQDSSYFSKALSYGVYFYFTVLEKHGSPFLRCSVHCDDKCRGLKNATCVSPTNVYWKPVPETGTVQCLSTRWTGALLLRSVNSTWGGGGWL